MALTNSTAFSRFSSNIAEDGAIAVFDVLPTDNINDPGAGGEYANDVVAMRGSIPWLNADTRFFAVQSSHTSKRCNAYYLNRKGTRYAEFPSVSGIPMNYGGSPLARYKALSDDIVGNEPFMLIPSLGMAHEYTDRAKSFEMWFNMEPYAKAAQQNIFEDDVQNLTLAAGTVAVTGTATKITDGSEWIGVSPLMETVELSAGGELDFTSQVGFMLTGSRDYMFSAAIYGDAGSVVDVSFDVALYNGGTKTYTTQITLTDFGQFSNLFGGGFSTTKWGYYTFEFSIDETMSGNVTQLRIGTDSIIRLSELKLIDTTSDIVETVVFEQPIIEFGGLGGTRVKITADADFMYLYGYGNVSNFQVGEWARPMYLVCVDNDKTFDVYIDCAPVMSITKDAVDDTLGPVVGEWILLSLSESFKYMDISTMALYPAALGQDIQRIHHLFGYGPKYNDVITHNPYDKVYVADGSATTFASQVLFPQTASFGIGEPTGLTVSNQLAIPDYQLPEMVIGDIADVNIYNIDAVGYGPHQFALPTDSEAIIRPSDISPNGGYMFFMVSPFNDPAHPEYEYNRESGLIARISSPLTGFNCNIVFAAVEGNNSLIDVRANIAYPFSALTYDEYLALYPSYDSDPNFQRATYTQAAGEASPFFAAQIDRRNFLLALNIDALRNSSNRDVAAIFNDPNIIVRMNDTCLYTYVAVSSREATLGNDIVISADNDLPEISVESAADDGTVSRNIIGNATYAVYPRQGYLDIAATGIWYVSMPLTNFATFVEGTPDLDFIVYSDQGQSPQLVTSLTTDIMSYDEFQRFADSDLTDLNGLDSTIAEYSDIQQFSDNSSLEYRQMGLDVDTSIPTLGRYANRAVRTFVTLDSPSRWPNKEYAGLAIENAGYNSYIDFENSPNSVVDTRWEIFDGFAIRIPKNINLHRYNLGYAVHMSSLSLRTRRPAFRRADFFGVATGDSPSNQIAVGSGSILIVGDREDINLDRPFSTHLVTETLPANYMSRELGFYPHGYSDENVVAPIYFHLSKDNVIKGISFYVNWRSENFRTTGTYQDKIGHLKYLDALNVEHYIEVGVQTIAPTVTPWLADIVVSPNTNVTIYVDGLAATQIEAGKWHQVYIDLTANGSVPLSDAGRDTVFAHTNEKAVLNYVASHSTKVSPQNLYSSRFGVTNESIFGDDFSASLHYGITESLTITDNANVTSITQPVEPTTGGVVPEVTVRINLDDNSTVV